MSPRHLAPDRNDTVSEPFMGRFLKMRIANIFFVCLYRYAS